MPFVLDDRCIIQWTRPDAPEGSATRQIFVPRPAGASLPAWCHGTAAVPLGRGSPNRSCSVAGACVLLSMGSKHSEGSVEHSNLKVTSQGAMKNKRRITPTSTVMSRIKRGLSGYVSYLSACGMIEAFSEYVLYEPILRIFTSLGFTVHCEHQCPGMPEAKSGDKKKLDFYATKDGGSIALEVKWIRSAKPSLDGDFDKLVSFVLSEKSSRSFLCLFGRKSDLNKVELTPPPWADVQEYGSARYADLRQTKFGCRVFEVLANA